MPQDPGETPRRASEEFDENDDLDISLNRRPPPRGDLTTGDWLLCIFCSGIACIIGIIRLIQGKPAAGKMIGVAFLFCVMWSIIRYALASVRQF